MLVRSTFCENDIPNLLIELCCYNNNITSLDNLTNSLIELHCDSIVKDYNQLMEKYNKK